MIGYFIDQQKNAKSKIGHDKTKNGFRIALTLKAPTEDVHLPIIKLAQNNETKGAILSVGKGRPFAVLRCCFINSGRLAAVEVLHDINKYADHPQCQLGIIKCTSFNWKCQWLRNICWCGNFTRFFFGFIFVSLRFILFGTDENLKIIAAKMKTAPKIR